MELEGDFDADGFLGKANVCPEYGDIRAIYQINTNAQMKKWQIHTIH